MFPKPERAWLLFIHSKYQVSWNCQLNDDDRTEHNNKNCSVNNKELLIFLFWMLIINYLLHILDVFFFQNQIINKINMKYLLCAIIFSLFQFSFLKILWSNLSHQMPNNSLLNQLQLLLLNRWIFVELAYFSA